MLDPAHRGKVDLFVMGPDDEFTDSRLARRLRADVLAVPCWVASAEDIVLAELRWRQSSRSEVQWRDCVEMCAADDLDTEYLRHWAHRLGVTDDLEDLLATTSAD